MPAARDMDAAALLDHGKEILNAIARDMARTQSGAEQQAKSEGDRSRASAALDLPSRAHGRQRERSGFEVGQMVGEFRALRATVLRL